MSAESMDKQQQLHIKDNKTLELEQTANVAMKSSQIDSLSFISSTSVENIESYVEVVPTCLQISTDSHDDEVSCQSGEQVSQSLNKSMKIDIDSKVSDTAEKVDKFYSTNTCSDSSKNEQKDDNKKIDDLSNKDDELFVDKNLIIQTSICKDMSESLKSDQAAELSDDYLNQMMKNVNDREMAIYEGTFLLLDETEYSQVHLDNAKKHSLLSEQEALIIDVSNKAENNEPLDEIKIVVENNDDSKENLHVIEKLMTIDNTFVKEVDEQINKNNINNHDMLSTEELLIIDESNSPNDDKETENDPSCKNIDKLESLTADTNTNEHQPSGGKIPLDKVENIDLKKAFSQCNLKDTNITIEPCELIDKIQHMDWLKTAGFSVMEMNRRKLARKSSIEKVECTEVVKQEFSEDIKSNSKSAKKRSSQSKNRKAKAADSSKQDSAEDQSKKSSNDAQLVITSKNETSKSVNVRTVEKSKDTHGCPQILGSQRISIGRGRNDRRKMSFGNSQPKGQSDISDQRNKYNLPLDIPIMEEKNFSKDEAHAQGSLYKILKVEDFIENKVAADSTKSRKTEICETEIDSRLDDGTGFLHDQLPVQSTSKCNESSTQKNEEKIYVQKDQLPSVSDDKESQNKSDINLSIRPIYGRLSDENKSEKVPFSVRGFGQKTNEIIEKNNQPLQSQNLSNEDKLNKFPQQFNKNQNYSKYSENKSHQSFNKQDYYFNKNSSFNNPSHDLPRWNHDKQNMKSNEFIMQKGFTSNRHRNIANENKQNEELLGKNQMFTDKCQGSKGFSDKSYDSRTSGNRYNERNHDNRNVHYQYSDKKQDYRNYGEWNSIKNHQDSKTYSEIVSDRNQGNRGGDKYFGNQNNKGFGEGFSDRNQDKAFGERYSDKVRDSKSFGNRYTDKNQQSKNSSEIFYDRSHVGNQMVSKKDEPLNKNPVSFDKNENCSDKSQIVTKSLDSSSKNQVSSDKNDHLNQAKSQEFSNRHQVHSDKYQENRYSNMKSPNSTKETFIKTQICPKTEDTNENNGRKNQDRSNNNGYSTEDHYLSQYQHPQEVIDKFTNNFWQSTEQKDCDKVKQNKSDVKSQKHYDNTQQAKVQKGSNQLQQSCSVPSVAHQQELPSTIDQNIELHRRVAHSTDLNNIQPIQSMDWNSYNTSKQDAVHAIELESASPFANVNVAMNSAVANEYKLHYNQTHLNASNQFNSNTTSFEQRPNVMTFEGNPLGINPGTVNQSQSCQVSNNDPSRPNTNSPVPSQQVCTNANVAQFFQSLGPAIANSQTTLAYSHSTMNVNAPPFEVPKQFNQESNNQTINAVQSPVSKSHTAAAFLLGNGCAVDPVRLNKISNYSEECLKLYLEVHELSKQLSLKQAQLISSQMKLFNAATEDDRATLNQPTSPPTQPIGNNQLVQEQNQPLPSNYVQVKHTNYPPGFGDVSLNVQSTQMNLYEMSTNVANVQNYAVEKLSSNNVSEPRINAQPLYLAQGNLYQPQAANYQVFTDKTANSATYINMIPQTDEQKQIRSSVIQFSKQ